MARIDPLDESDETERERARAALVDIQRRRNAIEEERRRMRNEERTMRLQEEILRRIVAGGGGGGKGISGTKDFHVNVVAS
jgi:hypothetical protein